MTLVSSALAFDGQAPGTLVAQLLHSAPGRVEVVVRGEVDALSAASLEQVLATAWASQPTSLVIDLRDNTFLGASSVRLLVQARDEAHRRLALFGILSRPGLVSRLVSALTQET